MMSERRFRGFENIQPIAPRIACNLCGSNGASVRCDKCQSMAFCLSCDDMYHRHPKRRYHLRKAVALEMPKNYLDSVQQNRQNTQNEGLNTGHPSKMPVPPPRRKKKGLTLSSIKETFTSTGNKLRRFVSNEKLSIPSVNGNRYLNECRPNETPLIDKPMQTIRTQTLQNQNLNQREVLPQNSSFGTLPTIRRHNSITVRMPEPKEQEPIPPPPPPPKPKPTESVYENYRKASLPVRKVSLPTNQRLGTVSSSIGDLSQEAPALPNKKIGPNTYDKRNSSLNDLRANISTDDISNGNPQQFCPHIMPNQFYYGLPIHPWTTSSLNNSIEDINLNDVEDYDSDVSARQNMIRNKRANIKRCQSAFQMYQGMSPVPPMQPFLYPYYYGYPCSGHTTPLPTCGSPHPMKPYNMSSRGSVDNMSTTSSTKGKTSSKPKTNQRQKVDPLESREQFSDSGGRSVTSSSRQQSDFDDDEDFYSVSGNDSSDDCQSNTGQWSCRFCTFLNDKDKSICEICSKTNKKFKKNSNKSGLKVNRKQKTNQKQNISQKVAKSTDNSNDFDFDEKLINEQKEIEKELIRRLENERRINLENEKIGLKEEFIRKKSLGLPVEDSLLDQIRKDQEFNQNNVNDVKIDAKSEVIGKNLIEKCVESKSTECQTTVETTLEDKRFDTKTTDTGMQTKSEHLSSNPDERCAKSVQCQFDDNPSVKVDQMCDKTVENSANKLVEQNKQNQNLNSDSSVLSGATNQLNNQFSHQNVSTPMTSMGQQFNDYNDRRNPYGPDPINHYQNPYHQNNYPMNPMMSQNVMSVNPINQMMSGYPMVPPMFANPLHNMYASPYQQSLNGSQTGLDRFGYRSNSITSEQSFMNPSIQSQIGSRYSSCENLLSINQLNDKNQQKTSIDSGLHLLQVLRDAEKNGFTSVDVEVALNFSPEKPIEWLEENWNNMCETVFTLTNNQIMQNQSKAGNKRLNQINLLTEEEAREGLRSTKGNIWQAIEKCVKSKQNIGTKGKNSPVVTNGDQNKGSFSLKISGSGSGRDNQDINDNIETTEVEEQVLVERQSSEERVTLGALTVHTAKVQRIETNADRKTMERLLTDWKIEKLSSDRFRQQEKERQKIRKFMELQKKMSEFDSEDSEQEFEFHDVPNDNRRVLETLNVLDNNELPDQLHDISDDNWQINSEFQEFLNEKSGNNEDIERQVSDFEEFHSNSDSDLSDEFDRIDARIQAKLTENFIKVKNEDIPVDEPITSDVINRLVDKFGENSSNGNKRIDDLKQIQSDLKVEPKIESKNSQKTELEVDFKTMANSGLQIETSAASDPEVKVEPNSDPKLESIVEPVVEPVFEPVFEPVVKPEVKSKTQSGIQLRNEPTIDPMVEPIVESKSDPNVEQAVDPKVEQRVDPNVEQNIESIITENLETFEVNSDSNKEMTKSEAKRMMKEIDRNVRRSLEELEQMELSVIQSQLNTEEYKRNQMYDESFGWARTEYECELCCETYSIEEMVSMISCTHYACRECLQKYYCVQVRERHRLIISCPFCEQPDIDPDDDDKVFDYLGLLDQVLKHLVPTDVYELFQRKLRDRALMREPGFIWCTQCSSGFIAPNPQAKTIMCPDCRNLTCTICKKKWKKQHMDITCEEFAEWERLNDPTYAEQQLDKHLKEFGIECPNCKFRYQLAKGGCMHFRCVQCSYDFCGGCARPFKMGNRCGVSPYCEKLGLHAHHPRNCLFYLRDKDTNKLQSLLDKHKISYKTKLDTDNKMSTRCPVMEQKHTSYGLKDEACNRFTENAGLCRLHYKEYLGDLIWKNGIDPIHIFNHEELELVLKRENVRLPPKDVYSSHNAAVRDEYQRVLIELILDKVPLNLHH